VGQSLDDGNRARPEACLEPSFLPKDAVGWAKRTRAHPHDRADEGEHSACVPLPHYTAAHNGESMLTLYSYPMLFGVADNNGYGLKVFAFLKLAAVPFRHE